MWPNPGPVPPFRESNPAFPPGYNPSYPTNSAAFPGFPANPAYPPNIQFSGHSTHTGGFYPQPPNPGYQPNQYPVVMNPAIPNGPPGVMPYRAPQPHLYHPGPHAYQPVPPPGVYPHGYAHSPKWGHYNGYYHKGVKPTSGIVAAGLTSMVVGAATHKANKKMRKKMKKAKKWCKNGFSSSSSSSSD